MVKTIDAPALGIYRLTRDVINPVGDRRIRHDFPRVQLWKAGSIFVIEPHDDLVGGQTEVVIIRPLRHLSQTIPFVERNMMLLSALVQHLELIPPHASYDNVILYAVHDRYRINPDDILKHLYMSGKVSLGDITSAIMSCRTGGRTGGEGPASDRG